MTADLDSIAVQLDTLIELLASLNELTKLRFNKEGFNFTVNTGLIV